MKKVFIYLVLLCSFYSKAYFFNRDRAALAAQKGDFKKADVLLSSLITNRPDDPNILYDFGVVAFNQKQFKQAKAYFKNSAENKNTSDGLKQDAYFNGGNTSIQLKKLEDAIIQYKKVLTLNPDHQEAQHNLELVKKMLEQEKQNQKQQDEKNQDQNNDKDKKKDDKNKESDNQQSDKQENDQRNKSESDKQDKKEQRKDDREEKRDEQSGQNKKPEAENDSFDNSESKKNQQKQEDQGQHDESLKQEQSQTNDKDDQSDFDESTSDGKNQQEVGAGPASQQVDQYDEKVMQVLAFIEEKDAESNKKMMAAQVKKATGAYDKNQNNY